VDVTTDGGVITARICQPNVEEHEASVILDRLRMVKVDRLYAFANDAQELQELVSQ